MIEPEIKILSDLMEADEKFQKERWTTHKRIGGMLKFRRIHDGLSLRKLGVRMKISAAYLSDLENGRRLWDEARIHKFITHLKS